MKTRESADTGSWTEHMLRGEFTEAWEISDGVLQGRRGIPCWHWPRHEQYVWDGTPLEGKRVLVRCYHGLGDTLQFVRYAPLVKAVAAEVIVWAQPILLPLLTTVDGIDRLLPLHDGVPPVDYDADVELMELPHVFRSTLATLPAQVPYVHAEPRKPKRAGRGINVGLVWQAGEWDTRRNVPLSEFAPLVCLPGVTLHAMQRGAGLREWLPSWGPVSGSDRTEQTARTLRALDLLISIDSMPAHLAGALAVPAWTLLHEDADWRWMRGRDDSPWYPSMRLFRRQKGEDWAAVIDRVCTELKQISSVGAD
jgi:hypothetical protein